MAKFLFHHFRMLDVQKLFFVFLCLFWGGWGAEGSWTEDASVSLWLVVKIYSCFFFMLLPQLVSSRHVGSLEKLPHSTSQVQGLLQLIMALCLTWQFAFAHKPLSHLSILSPCRQPKLISNTPNLAHSQKPAYNAEPDISLRNNKKKTPEREMWRRKSSQSIRECLWFYFILHYRFLSSHYTIPQTFPFPHLATVFPLKSQAPTSRSVFCEYLTQEAERHLVTILS